MKSRAISVVATSIFVMLVCSFGRASADEPASTPPEPTTPTPTPPTSTPTPTEQPADGSTNAGSTTTGSTTTGLTIVAGRVIDVLGRPISNARVYVLPRRGQPHQTKTTKDGRYSVQVSTLGTHGVVIAIDKAHTFRTVLVQQGVTNTLDIDVELDSQGGEVIKIEDRKRPVPKVKAKPVKDPRLSLPYSEEAVERDAWARAWLLLDVDERGVVTRIKLLKRPGFDLDKICIEQALGLKFDPALDHAGRPMKTYMLWTMEWPAWGWIIQGNGIAVRRPADHYDIDSLTPNFDIRGTDLVKGVERPIGGPWARPLATATALEGALDRVPCAGSGPLNLDLRNRAYRDCSQPDLGVIDSLPWITKETAATAIAELANPKLLLVTDEGEPGSPWPGYIGAGVSGVLAIATVYGFYQWDKWQTRAQAMQWQATVDPKEHAHTTQERNKWGTRAFVLTGAALVSTGITFLIWNRDAPRSSFSVQPTEHGNGGAATFQTKW